MHRYLELPLPDNSTTDQTRRKGNYLCDRLPRSEDQRNTILPIIQTGQNRPHFGFTF